MSRASTPDLREYLEQRRQKVLLENEEAANRIKSQTPKFSEETLQKYFSSWIPSTVHIATSSKAYRTVEALSRRLKLEEAKVREILFFLQQLGLIVEKKQNWEFTGKSLHFPRNSAVNTSHQVARRHQAIRSIEQENSDNVHFPSIFTLSKESFKKLKLDLLRYVEESHLTIHASGTDEIYGMCLDLFRVE